MIRFSPEHGHARIARRFLRIGLRALDSLPPEPKEDREEWLNYHAKHDAELHRIDEARMIVIVFAASALEAYAYEIASRRLGDDVAKEVDRVPAKQRWGELAKRLGTELDPNVQHLVDDLVDRRKLIMHPKSFDPRDQPEQYEEHMTRGRLDGAMEAVRTLDAVIPEALRLDDKFFVENWLGDSPMDAEIDKAWSK